MIKNPTRRIFGMTWRGWLNFIVLQWFFVRLASVYTEEQVIIRPGQLHAFVTRPVKQGELLHSGDIVSVAYDTRKREVHSGWSLARFIWPLTGWWSPLRYVRSAR